MSGYELKKFPFEGCTFLTTQRPGKNEDDGGGVGSFRRQDRGQLCKRIEAWVNEGNAAA